MFKQLVAMASTFADGEILPEVIRNNGLIYASLGIALAILLSGIGSSIAVGKAGQLASGLLTKDPSKFTGLLLVQALPATQTIYGFVVAIVALGKVGIMGGSIVTLTDIQGLSLMMLCLPVAVVGLVSAIYQGKVGMACMELMCKQEGQLGRAFIMCAMVEFFAIFAFLISFLGVSQFTV